MQLLQKHDNAELVEVDQEERLDDSHGAEETAGERHQSEGRPPFGGHPAEASVCAVEEGLHEHKWDGVEEEDHKGYLKVGQPRREHDPVEAPQGRRDTDQGRAEGGGADLQSSTPIGLRRTSATTMVRTKKTTIHAHCHSISQPKIPTVPSG